MATRDVIEKKINEISDGGNNSAAEMRGVLTDLLDYTENTDTNVQLPLFEFWEETPVKDDKNNGSLWYSFRGIEKAYANLTFRLLINESNATNFIFRLDDKIMEVLSNFFQQPMSEIQQAMSFVVSLTDTTGKRIPRIWVLFIQMEKDRLILILKKDGTTNDRTQQGDEIFTSIQFHCPPFNFDKK